MGCYNLRGMVSLGLGEERRGALGVRFWGIIDWGPHHQDASGAARMSRARRAPWDRVLRDLARPAARDPACLATLHTAHDTRTPNPCLHYLPFM